MKPLPSLETCTNGQIRQLIEAVAELQSKVSEILEDSPLVILPKPFKRGPGRPRKDATA